MKPFTGRVKAYNQKTGKGSIAPDEGGDDVSVDRRGSGGHRLSKGQKVSFLMIHRPDGIYAYDVKLI
ncbi:DNA-binding protein [Pseudomonas fluorescens]|jgi:CspA family cold shock protein|uniref:Cold-shock protein n=2 Tax=Pseudomonas TaxID=286 RepID=A0A1B3DCT4_PSEFL|nr:MULTISPECIES: cold shock domain-containing protein [Pseudomonas]AHC37097.1 DNA-binding protein [Pseudomonas sp. TKP]AOE69321.1 DNA-binding protein [Pseudomonas fluorescens]AOE75098.1 DNA-binding protein [Pseudomonas fluorescens]MBL1306414.1 cold-shock protein [Pseudomonas sp.]PMX05873.1 cold-shock protein [Pseudomonas sp. MPBC4-3]